MAGDDASPGSVAGNPPGHGGRAGSRRAGLRPRRDDARPGAARRPAGMALRPAAAGGRGRRQPWPTCGPCARSRGGIRSNPPPRWRTAAFLGGLAAIVVALCSPIEALRGAAVQRPHGAAHAAGAGGRAAAAAGRAGDPGAARRRRRRSGAGCWRVLHSRAVAVLTFPLLTWLLFAAVNWGWHFSTLYDQALENDAASLPPARDLPGRRAAVLVAGDRRRSGPMAPPLPGRASSTSSWPCRRTRSWAWR